MIVVKPVRRACARGWIFGQDAWARAARAKCSLAGLTTMIAAGQTCRTLSDVVRPSFAGGCKCAFGELVLPNVAWPAARSAARLFGRSRLVANVRQGAHAAYNSERSFKTSASHDRLTGSFLLILNHLPARSYVTLLFRPSLQNHNPIKP